MNKKILIGLCLLFATTPACFAYSMDAPVEFDPTSPQEQTSPVTENPDFLYKNSPDGGMSTNSPYSLRTTPMPTNFKTRQIQTQSQVPPPSSVNRSTPMNYSSFPKNRSSNDAMMQIPNASGDMFNLLY